MVSFGTITSLGGLAVGLGIGYLLLKNAGSIGSAVGSTLGGGLSSGIVQFGEALRSTFVGGFTSGSETQIVNTLGLENQISGSLDDGPFGEVTPKEIGRLTFAQFLKEKQLGGRININTGFFQNKFTSQPLDFTIDSVTGSIRTGRVGLGSKTINAQTNLAKEFGIPTFDTMGNLSNFGGFN